MERFALSEIQAQAILDMRLRALTGLSRDKIEAEYNALVETIKHLREILANEYLVLNIIKEDVVLCFFNSLFTISNNSDLFKDLCKVLRNMKNFYIVCDYTINSNYHMPKEEQDFLNSLQQELRDIFKFKQFDILEGNGIIITGER